MTLCFNCNTLAVPCESASTSCRVVVVCCWCCCQQALRHSVSVSKLLSFPSQPLYQNRSHLPLGWSQNHRSRNSSHPPYSAGSTHLLLLLGVSAKNQQQLTPLFYYHLLNVTISDSVFILILISKWILIINFYSILVAFSFMYLIFLTVLKFTIFYLALMCIA